MTGRKKTKIVATLGPATDSREVINDLLIAGVNVFRINFSHADYDDVIKRIKYIREQNEANGFNAAILADLQGPKLRVGVMEEGTVVNTGDLVTFKTGEPFVGNATKAYMNYSQFPKDVKAGERVLVDDGKVHFEVVSTNGSDEVVAKVTQGGPFKSKKGVNLPNTDISLPALTEKDVEDAIFACKQDVDWIALSFVRHAKDVKLLQELISEHSDFPIPIISKIEKPEGVENIDEILEVSGGLMVARGDLGVEIPANEVPLVQKELVNKAKLARKPVIIATQMMETMIDSLTPTRAEVNDVANSIMDGADAVMLSGETSVGQYPVQVIQTMRSIINSVENSPLISVPQTPPDNSQERFITDSVCYHAAHIANNIKAGAISTLTNSGYTAYQISAWRPSAHIVVYSDNRRILAQLNLLWGVKAFYYNNESASTDQTIEEVNKLALERGYVSKGDNVVNLVSTPLVEKGNVNTLKITEL